MSKDKENVEELQKTLNKPVKDIFIRPLVQEAITDVTQTICEKDPANFLSCQTFPCSSYVSLRNEINTIAGETSSAQNGILTSQQLMHGSD